MRIASFNVENMFLRAKALTWKRGPTFYPLSSVRQGQRASQPSDLLRY